MIEYEFNVVEYDRGNHTHHWKAIDKANGKEIDFYENNDGNNQMFGRYPSIQKYLKDEYNVEISLVDDLTGKNPNIDKSSNTATWIFVDEKGNKVKITDIPRTIFRLNA